MQTTYKQTEIRALATRIQAEGLRVFLSEDGTFGFFTGDGTSVVSFQLGLGGFSFSTNHKSDQPYKDGTGCQICDTDPGSYSQMLSARGGYLTQGKTRPTTLDEHLATYGKCCGYHEVTA